MLIPLEMKELVLDYRGQVGEEVSFRVNLRQECNQTDNHFTQNVAPLTAREMVSAGNLFNQDAQEWDQFSGYRALPFAVNQDRSEFSGFNVHGYPFFRLWRCSFFACFFNFRTALRFSFVFLNQR